MRPDFKTKEEYKEELVLSNCKGELANWIISLEEDNKKLTGYILDIISSCQDLEIEIGTLEEIKKDLQI